MTGRNELLLLDTNIVIHLIRDNEVGKRVDAAFQIRHRADRPLISIVTIGECLSFGRQFKWGDKNVRCWSVTVSFTPGRNRSGEHSDTMICGSPRLPQRPTHT